MRRILPGVSILALLAGLLSQAGILRLTATETSPYSRRVNEWHRLVEAAGMTGDSDVMKEVRDHLACANTEGEPRGLLVESAQHLACKVDHDSLKELRYDATGEYGSFWKLVTDSHLAWSLQNQDFLKSVNNRARAREYVRLHRWPR